MVAFRNSKTVLICRMEYFHTALKLDYYSNAIAFFHYRAVSCSVSIQTAYHCLTIKCTCRVFSDNQKNPASWVWNALQVELFPTHEVASLLGCCLDIDQMDRPQKQKCACKRAIWQTLSVRVWIQLKDYTSSFSLTLLY